MELTHTNIHALRPGFLSPSAGLKFADIPNGLAAISKVPMAGWAQIAAYFGFVEFSGGFDDYKTGTPGDYGFKVLTASDPAEKTKKLSAELANGRLAMMAIIGMFFQAASIAYSLLFQTACASAFALFVHVTTSLSCCNFGLLVFWFDWCTLHHVHLMYRMASLAAPGAIGPTTPHLLFAHSRTSSECRPLWDSGIRLVCLPTAAWRTSSAAVLPR